MSIAQVTVTIRDVEMLDVLRRALSREAYLEAILQARLRELAARHTQQAGFDLIRAYNAGNTSDANRQAVKVLLQLP